MLYSIQWLEEKTTTTGKKKYDCTLTEAAGDNPQVFEKVTIWAEFPGFADMKPGSTVEGNMVAAKDPRWGPTLFPATPKAVTGGGRTAMMEKTMEKKAEAISKAQDKKVEGIQQAAIIRDATLTALAEIGHTEVAPDDFDRAYQFAWEKWAKFYSDKWDTAFY